MAKQNYVVIGLGATGLSCVRFLKRLSVPIVVMDTREAPPNLAQFKQTYPEIPCFVGSEWPQQILNEAKQIILSPGVSIDFPLLKQAKSQQVEIIGDIELFARFNQVPVIAITGSNGKSTVTTLVGEMAKTAGKKVAVVGNIGLPVLDIFTDHPTRPLPFDLIVMELSSFQLETISSLAPTAATVLNVSPDHLDRYSSYHAYSLAKQRIYRNAKYAILNKQDPFSFESVLLQKQQQIFFTLETPSLGEFGVRKINGKQWLAFGNQKLIPSDSLKLVGQHNVANGLSALALGQAAGLSLEPMLEMLQNFSGLAHRCQHVAQHDDIDWINDSKGTNIGACLAAMKGIGSSLSGKIILLLGGDGKGADFSELLSDVRRYCRHVIVMGKDTPLILAALGKNIPITAVLNMQDAVTKALDYAKPGDVVLLSPACSSLDQYQNFSHRGEVFMQAVKEVIGNAHPS